MSEINKILESANEIYDTLACSHPKLERGQVWCHYCGATQKVDSAESLRNGWAKCCGYTMSLGSPTEREELRK